MTYRPGISAQLAAMCGLREFDREYPNLTCDGCGYCIEVKATRGGAPAWLRNNKAPKGWERHPRSDAAAKHLCPVCVMTNVEAPR